MSTLPSLDAQHGQAAPEMHASMRGHTPTVAVCLPSMPADDLTAMVQNLRQLFAGESLVIASPDQAEEQALGEDGARIVPYPVQRTDSEWVLNALDYAAAYLGGYAEAVKARPELLPQAEEAKILLSSLLLEKAFYELLYELNNRPTWLSIPLQGLLTLLSGAADAQDAGAR